jgi:hypothetical protein
MEMNFHQDAWGLKYAKYFEKITSGYNLKYQAGNLIPP